MKRLLKTPPFICNSRTTWDLIKKVDNDTTFFVQMGDIHPYRIECSSRRNTSIIINSKYVVMDQCDKNFVFYWLNRRTFPNMNLLILNSHPCEPSIIRFLESESNQGTKVYLKEHWSNYLERWGTIGSKIKIIPNDKYENLFPEGFIKNLRSRN